MSAKTYASTVDLVPTTGRLTTPDSERLVVLQLISSSGMYGAESVVMTLAKTLRNLGHRCVVGIFNNIHKMNGELYSAALDAGIESYLLNCQGRIDRGTASGIRHLVEEIGAEVVHCHGYKADLYAYWALRTSEVPLISTCHNWIDDGLAARMYGWLDRRVLRKYERIAAVSRPVEERLLNSGVHPACVRMIRNGIDVSRFSEVIPELRPALGTAASPLVGLVGRLSREKGVDVFLRAAALVTREISEVKFVIVGDGPERQALEDLVDQLNIRPHVIMLGVRRDMPSVYASFDMLVLSSRTEGLPIALLEGMASGIPVISTRVGQIPEVLRNGLAGVLIPAEDERCLANAIVRLLKDPSRRSRLGSAACQVVRSEYSAERMAHDYLRAYREAGAVVHHHAYL